jgi:hypothetical protein
MKKDVPKLCASHEGAMRPPIGATAIPRTASFGMWEWGVR